MTKTLFSHLQEMAEFSDAIRAQAHILLFMFVSWKWIKISINSLLSLFSCVFFLKSFISCTHLRPHSAQCQLGLLLP